MDVIIKGFLFSLALNATFGATNVEVIRRGMTRGLRSSVFFILGNLTICTLYFILIILGFSFISGYKLFNVILLAFGTLVLLYLTYDALKDFLNKKEFDLTIKKENKKDDFMYGIFLSLGNSAIPLILIGFIGADLSSNPASLQRGLLLGLGMLISYILFFVCFVSLIQIGRKFIHRKYLRYISLISSIMLCYLSLKFGYKLITALR